MIDEVLEFLLVPDTEQRTDLRGIFEERILDSRVEFSVRELLRIAKREFYDLLTDLVKRKWQSTEEPGSIKVNMNVVLMADAEVEDELPESHYTKPPWAHATTETLVLIGNVRDLVIALIDHGSEINLMSKDLQLRPQKISSPLNIPGKIKDVEIDQNFFV